MNGPPDRRQEEEHPEEALRREVWEILRAGLNVVEPTTLVEAALRREPLPPGKPWALLAVGKAARRMARGALRAAGDHSFGAGLVLAPEPEEGVGAADTEGPFPVHFGEHPLPGPGSVEGARRARGLARSLEPGQGLLLLLSGGGSSLLTLPENGLTPADLEGTVQLLLHAGASIHELNGVRKHLERLKGGGLALEAGPRPLRALVISDVVGDPPDVIASGPVSPDLSTFGEALETLERRGVRGDVPAPVLHHLQRGRRGQVPETPKPGDPRLAHVELQVVGNVERALESAAEAARAQSRRAWILSSSVEGEARRVGRALGALGRSLESGSLGSGPLCLLAGGETTVQVRGKGRGGRNQEVALGAALELAGGRDLLVASMGTDGIDGPTDAAGALATGSTLERARQRGLDPWRALAENDSYPFFQALGDLLVTGPTGTNVMDVQVVLVGRREGGEGGAAHSRYSARTSST